MVAVETIYDTEPTTQNIHKLREMAITANNALTQGSAKWNAREILLEQRIERLSRKCAHFQQPGVALRMLACHYEYELLTYILNNYSGMDEHEMRERLAELSEPKDD